jgi:hypothetical protein
VNRRSTHADSVGTRAFEFTAIRGDPLSSKKLI